MPTKLVMVLIVEALDGGILNPLRDLKADAMRFTQRALDWPEALRARSRYPAGSAFPVFRIPTC